MLKNINFIITCISILLKYSTYVVVLKFSFFIISQTVEHCNYSEKAKTKL